MSLRDCLKQTTECMIVRRDGSTYTATNQCDVPEDTTICPRVTAGCLSGEGYELCGPPQHAEARAAVLARESMHISGDAFLYGHTYLCADCQHALVAVNVRTFHVMEGL